ncbi:MAG: cytochrome [Pseudomonas sp.]|nr:cytochrome [Pseudomonas sp.]
MRRLWIALIPLLCCFTFGVKAADQAAAQLTLALPDGVHTWTTAQLLAHPKIQQVQIPDDVSYKRAMTYRAVPMAALLGGVKASDHVQAVATDGFAAEIPAAPLLQQAGAQAWLAIEDPAAPWPKLGDGDHSAGPFYLVWTNPRASNIGPEEWPYAMASVKVLASVAERFPAMLPDPKLAADDPINRGFAVFQKSCLACHRLNGAGDSQLGPDLNLPHSPTEYFAGDFLKRYIRDPQSLRQWPQAKMPAISAAILTDGDLDLVIGYLKHMAQRRAAE